MNEKLLKSVVEMTGQRNANSLGYCVIMTLAEFVPFTQAKLEFIAVDQLHLVAQLNRSFPQQCASQGQWIHSDRVTPLNDDQHIPHPTDIEPAISEQGEHCYSIPIDEKSSARLTIVSTNDLQQHDLLIRALTQIYKNYLVILHENERDKLTGLLNRKTMEERMRLFYEGAHHDEEGLSTPWVAMLDLDHFKSINDGYGHLIGDEVLLMFAQQMRSSFSDQEHLFRFGGEEFVIVFPNRSQEAVRSQLEGFCRHIEGHYFPQVEHITFSAGVCPLERKAYLPTILDRADHALYQAKALGRNQVCFVESCQSERPDSDVELF